jgi:hypothetical protein
MTMIPSIGIAVIERRCRMLILQMKLLMVHQVASTHAKGLLLLLLVVVVVELLVVGR